LSQKIHVELGIGPFSSRSNRDLVYTVFLQEELEKHRSQISSHDLPLLYLDPFESSSKKHSEHNVRETNKEMLAAI
jgi:hypothetical protein